MESDESIDLVDSEAVNVYGSVVAKEERENLASISKKVKMLIHHVFIHSSIFLNWSLPSLLCRWRSCNDATKLKIIKRPEVRYFSIFLFEIKKCLYGNVLPSFTILKRFQAA